MAGWTNVTQLALIINAAEYVDMKDLSESGSADANVAELAITTAARILWAVIQGRDDYGADGTMAPEAYTAASGTFPVLEAINTYLALAILATCQGADTGTEMSDSIYDHWTMRLARDIRNGDADVVAT